MLRNSHQGPASASVLLVVMLAVFASPAPAQEAGEWYELDLPGPASDLAAVVGLSATRPRAQFAQDLVRLLHAVPPGQNRVADSARERAHQWLSGSFASPVPGAGSPARSLPSPLPVATWQALLPGSLTASQVGGAVILDRRASLLAYGLWGMDAATRYAMAARPELLAAIYKDHAAAFAAFGRSLGIVDGKVVIGAPFSLGWESVIGARLAVPDEFIPRLLGTQQGRLAYCLDAVSDLDGRRQQFLLGASSQDREGSAHGLRALARLCATLRPEWNATLSPFTRPVVDLATVVRQLDIDKDGRLVGPRSRAFWTRVFAGPAVANAAAAQWAEQVTRSEPADAAWLLHQVFDVDPATSLARFRALLFLQRRFGALSELQVDLVRATRAAVLVPALTLVLERMGEREPSAFAAAAAAVASIQMVVNPERARGALLQFQGTIALIDRAHFSRTLDDRAASDLVASLARLAPARERDYEGTLADWLTNTLLPALRARQADPPEDADLLVIGALAGRGSRVLTAPGEDAVEWEGLEYRADPGAAEFARITRVRQRQGGPGLSEALDFRRSVLALAKADDRDARTALKALAQRMPTVPLIGVRGPGDAGRLPDLMDEALRDIEAHAAGPGRVRALERLTMAGDAVLTDALAALAYAVHLGVPNGLVTLAPDAARRHSFATRIAPLGVAWDLPVELLGGGQPWHLVGSLLALEHALAPLALADRLGDDMPSDPRVTAPDRRALAHGMALMSPFALGDRERDAIAAATARGRARVESAIGNRDALAGLAREAGWSSWRRGALDYSTTHEPAAVSRLFTLSDHFWMGIGADFDATVLAPWGVASPATGGGLVNAWPQPRPWEDVTGRAGSGQIGAHQIDATLRVVEAVSRLRLPAALVPGILASALSDLAYRAPLAFDDDWFALAAHAREWTDPQLDDYIAALTADGPLVVPDVANDGIKR